MTMLHLTKIKTDRYGQNGGTQPVSVNAESIRCFYARKDERPGTRLTFTDGGGFAVAEPYEAVRDYIENGTVPAAPNVTSLALVQGDNEEREQGLRDENE
jgi:hypothetical protein